MSKGLKVRRSKGLYKKRKSGLRKAVEVAILLAVMAGLGFVGFTVADVLLNYEPKIDVDDIPADNPEVTLDEGTENERTESPAGSDEPDEPAAIRGNAVYAPSNVLASSAALSSYLETAKAGGFDAIVVEMKDEEGRLLYRSEIKKVTDADGLSVGTLTAEQIANAAVAAGLKPIARISTLKDHIGAEKIDDVSYFGWVDNVPGIGKRWANPFLDGTTEYISDITAELHQAGFSEIIFTNTIFPLQTFRGLDFEVLPSYVTDSSIRFAGLGDFVNKVAAKNPDANIFLEMSLDCFNGSTPVGSAEILRCTDSKSNNGGDIKLNVGGIVLTFSRGDFTSEPGAAISSPEKTVKDGLAKVKPYAGDLDLVPMLDRDGLPESDCEKIIAAFGANKMKNFIIRN